MAAKRKRNMGALLGGDILGIGAGEETSTIVKAIVKVAAKY